MINKKATHREKRLRRHRRIRAVVTGTSERPRLSVFRSNTELYLQLVDDVTATTLVSAHSKTDGREGDAGERSGKTKQSYLLGKVLAEKAKQKNIQAVVFDRGGYLYHGRVKAAAEGARDGGLQF